jgi:hypothetical protein
MLRAYSQLEDAHLLAQAAASPLPPPVVMFNKRIAAAAASSAGGAAAAAERERILAWAHAEFWPDMLTFATLKKVHVFEYVVETGMRLVRDRDFAAVGQLMAPFGALRGLLVLVSPVALPPHSPSLRLV